MGEVKNTKTKKTSLFKGLKAEFDKIIWPSRKTLVRESTAVVISAIVLGAVISIVDLFIKYGIDMIVK